MKSYCVSVYHVDDEEDDLPCDRITIHLSLLSKRTVETEDEKMAATKAWIETVGQARKKWIDSNNGPEAVSNYQVSEEDIARDMIRCSLCPNAGGFLFDNGIEAWLIGVEPTSGPSKRDPWKPSKPKKMPPPKTFHFPQ